MNEELSEDDWRDDVIADEINEDDWMVDMTLKQTLQVAPLEKFDYNRIDISRQSKAMELPLLIGKKEDGSVLVVDLARMPHLLMAGATGQGKTTLLETMLYGFISRFTPEEIKFVLYDEKRVEFVQWERSPYLTMSVVNEPKEALRVLKVLSGDMDRRFKILAAAGCRNIQEFNNRNAGETIRLPYLVFVADEIADLMAGEGKRAIIYLSRLTAMGRAAGIHIVLSTQRPDRKVLTSLLKANIPGRIAFKVCSGSDSLQVIDARGAENLNGRGDLLFKSGTDEIVRAQGAYVPYETLFKRIEATTVKN